MKKALLFVIVFLIGILVYSHLPTTEQAQQEADHLAWCDSIYHQNVGCSKHGQVEIPAAVIAKQEADHLAWCDSIGHRNVSCPNFRR